MQPLHKFLLIVLIAGHIFESLLCATERCYEGLWGFGVPVPRLLSKESSIHIKLFSSQSSWSTSSVPQGLWKENSIHTNFTLPMYFSLLPQFFLSNLEMEVLSAHWIFSPRHLWRWKIFLLFFSPLQLPNCRPPSVPFLIPPWEVHSQDVLGSDPTVKQQQKNAPWINCINCRYLI